MATYVAEKYPDDTQLADYMKQLIAIDNRDEASEEF